MNAEAAGTPGGRRVPWGLLGSIALAVAVGVAVFVLPRAKKEPVRPPAVEALAPAAPAAPPAPEPVVVEPSTPAPVEPAAPVAVETPVPDEPPPAPAPQARVERPAAPQSPRGWRGDGQGLYLSARPAIEWSAEKNVLWAAKMPSWSNSSPAVVGGRVFVCAESSTLVCVDAGTGTVLWKRSNDERDARRPPGPSETSLPGPARPSRPSGRISTRIPAMWISGSGLMR